MRRTMLRMFLSLSVLALVSFGFEQAANAGIIITDGKVGGRTQSNTPTVENPEDDKHAQEIYLWASMVFAGYAVNSDGDNDNPEVDENGNIVISSQDSLRGGIPRAAIIDDVSGEPMGGCASARGAPYVLAVFLLRWRRRRPN